MPPRRQLSPAKYNEFIRQVDLRAIWVASARIDNRVGARRLEDENVEIQIDGAHEPIASGFRLSHTYRLRVRDGRDDAGEIEVTFAVEYMSKQRLTAGYFEIFREINLPLVTWPYLRAFVADAFSQMGWGPITLPSFKTGAPGSEE
jgi:hypothetical protein